MPVTRFTATTTDGRPISLAGRNLTTADVLTAVKCSAAPGDSHSPYKVGDLIHFQDDDPEFVTRAEAEKHARKLYESDSDSAYGIWDVDGMCVAIFYVGALYTP